MMTMNCINNGKYIIVGGKYKFPYTRHSSIIFISKIVTLTFTHSLSRSLLPLLFQSLCTELQIIFEYKIEKFHEYRLDVVWNANPTHKTSMLIFNPNRPSEWNRIFRHESRKFHGNCWIDVKKGRRENGKCTRNCYRALFGLNWGFS